MTTIDYEKKYKEAIKYLKAFIDGDCVTDSEILADFPELRESEDERIRKEIIGFIQSQIEDGNSAGWDRWIAWLEKQKEQKPVWADIPYCSSEPEWSEEDERIYKGVFGKIDHDQSYGVSKVDMLNWLKSRRPQK